MGDHVFQELQVRRDAPDPEFTERPVHPRDRLVHRVAPRGDLHQQRIVKGCDDGARVRGAAVQPQAKSGGAAIGRKPSIVGRKALFRVFGRDPALNRMAVDPDRRLCRQQRIVVADPPALGHSDLGLHDIHAGDLLGHRVLDLDPRIDFDEVIRSAVGIHQELPTNLVGQGGCVAIGLR